MDAAGIADPTGTISAVTSGIRLISVVLKAAPGLINAAGKTAGAVRNATAAGKTGRRKPAAVGGGGAPQIHRSATAGADAIAGVELDRETRAYETVNYVLRFFGTRIGEAGLVDTQALAKALSHATEHIEIKLLSVEVNRLFESLASKLGDPVLVSSVFTSIYFLGALTAELSRSLPNYKVSYTPLGPQLVQQLFRAVIGEDAFKNNLTANLEAFKTLSTTAGLLRPTDIGSAIFPGFPSLSPCRYSSRSSTDVRNHKAAYEKLIKHFEKFGFPQPVIRPDVCEIKEWRFLAGDKNTKTFEVEKADKHIGENFGYVLHWLVCSADRMSPGAVMIAYFSQHIELIHWLGSTLGCAILNAGSDLDMSGPHSKLDKKARAIFNTWVVLVPTVKGQADRKTSSAAWPQDLAGSKINMLQASNALASQKTLTKKPLRSSATSPAAVPAQTPATALTRKPAPSLAPSPQPKPIVNQQSTGSPVPQKQQERLAPSTSTASSPPLSPLSSISLMSPPLSPLSSISPISPPYSPTDSITSHTTTSSYSLPSTRPISMIRRKAPAPPQKFTNAKARYDFLPADGNDEELAFCKGDDIEIVEKNAVLNDDGWCRARIKGSAKVGLVPLKYLKEEEKVGSSSGTSRPNFPLANSEMQPSNAGIAGNAASPGKPYASHRVQWIGGPYLKEEDKVANGSSAGVAGGAIQSGHDVPGARSIPATYNSPPTHNVRSTHHVTQAQNAPSTLSIPPTYISPSTHNVHSTHHATQARNVPPAPNILPARNVLPAHNAARPVSRDNAAFTGEPHVSHSSQHTREPTNTKPPPKSSRLPMLSHSLQHMQRNAGGSNSPRSNYSGPDTAAPSSCYPSTTNAPYGNTAYENSSNYGMYSNGPFSPENFSSNSPMYGGITMDPSMMYSGGGNPGGGSNNDGTMDLAALSLMANATSVQAPNISFGSDPGTTDPSANSPNNSFTNLSIPDMSQLQDAVSGTSTPFLAQDSLDTATTPDLTTDPSAGTNPYDSSYGTTSAMTGSLASLGIGGSASPPISYDLSSQNMTSPLAALTGTGGLTPPPDPTATPPLNIWDQTSYSAPYDTSDASANAASANDAASIDLSAADAAYDSAAEQEQSTVDDISQSAIAEGQQCTADDVALAQNAMSEDDEEDDPGNNDYSDDDGDDNDGSDDY